MIDTTVVNQQNNRSKPHFLVTNTYLFYKRKIIFWSVKCSIIFAAASSIYLCIVFQLEYRVNASEMERRTDCSIVNLILISYIECLLSRRCLGDDTDGRCHSWSKFICSVRVWIWQFYKQDELLCTVNINFFKWKRAVNCRILSEADVQKD